MVSLCHSAKFRLHLFRDIVNYYWCYCYHACKDYSDTITNMLQKQSNITAVTTACAHFFVRLLYYMSVVGVSDTYVASTVSFLPRNIASLHQPDMFPTTVAHAGGSTPIRDEEGGSTPVLDEPDDDDIAVAPNYGTPMVLSNESKSALQQNFSAGQPAGNPEFPYRLMQMNEGIVSSQLPDENGGGTAPVQGTYGSDGTIVYRTEVVDGFQSASEAFHPPPDFFRSEADFSIPPPMTIYQVKDEGFGHASESLPVLPSSERDVVYTVVTTVQQPAPASYYPVVIEVPSFAEPPPKLNTYPPPPASFVHPPPAMFNPNLPPPTLPPSNLPPPPALPPLPAPAVPVSLQYTVPPPANIQVVVPHTLRSPLPAPPKSSGPQPVYVPQQSTSYQSLVPTVRTLHSPSHDDKRTTTSYRPVRTLHSPIDDKKTTTTSYRQIRTLHSSSDDDMKTTSTPFRQVRTLHSPVDDTKTTTTSYRSVRTLRSSSDDDMKTTTTPFRQVRTLHSSSDDDKTTNISFQRVQTLHSSVDDKKTTTSYQPLQTLHSPSYDQNTTSTSYRQESILQGIRHIRDSQQKDTGASIVSVIPTIGASTSGQSYTQQKPTPPKSPVAARPVPALMSLKQSDEVARRMNKAVADGQPSPSFAGGKRKPSGSLSEDSLLQPEVAKHVREAEPELNVEMTDEDIAGELSDEFNTDQSAGDAGKDYEYREDSVEGVSQIPCLLPSNCRTPFQGRAGIGGGPRLFGFRPRGLRAVVSPMRPRMARIPRMPRPVFRGGPMQFWGGGR